MKMPGPKLSEPEITAYLMVKGLTIKKLRFEAGEKRRPRPIAFLLDDDQTIILGNGLKRKFYARNTQNPAFSPGKGVGRSTSMENRESKPLGKTVRIRGDVVRALRIQEGWTAADLSDKAGCSQRTIDTMEASKNVIPNTVAKVAKALGVEIRTLIDGPAGLPHPSPGAPAATSAEPPRIDVRIHITQLDDDKDGTKRLPGIMRDIQSAVGTQDDVHVNAIDVTNKINIHIAICPHELVRFVGFFCAGRLDYHTFESMDFRPNALLEPLLKALAPERSDGGLSSRVGRGESSVETGSGAGRTEEGPVARQSGYGQVSHSDTGGHTTGHYSSIMIKYRREHRKPHILVNNMLDTGEILTAITWSREHGMFRSCVSSDGLVTID